MSKKTKWRTELSEGFACPIPASMRPILRRGDESFLVLWRTVETNTNLLRGVIGSISTWNEYLNTVFNDVVSLRGAALARSPREKLQLVAVEGLVNKGANTDIL